MATEFKLPELGEGVTSGTVATLLASVGDTVAADTSIIEIETDKAVAEIPIPFGGKITEIRVKVGDSVSVGQVILVADESAGGGAAEKPAAAPEEKPEPAPKAAAKPAPAAKAAPAPAKPAPKAAAAKPAVGGRVLASPSVRKLARNLGVQLTDVPTSDPSGRVTAQDVEAFASSSGATPPPASESTSAAPAATTAPVPVTSAAPAVAGAMEDDRWGKIVRDGMSGVRKKTAAHMTHCWTTIPHVTHFEKADITALEQVRKQYAPAIKAEGGSLTVTVFLMKVITEALRRFPKFNASIDLENEQVILKQYYNIGVAVDTPAGLLVPAIRDVDKKSLQELALELPGIAKKARDRKLTLEDMSGTTFTISNLGGLGGTGFTPIINSPEVAILGVSRSAVEGEIGRAHV